MNHPSPVNSRRFAPSRPEPISFQKLRLIIAGKWMLLLALLVGALISAFLASVLTLPTYRVSSTVLIQEGAQTTMPGADRLMQGFGMVPGSENLDNQMEIISSRKLVQEALEELSFEIDFYRKGLFKKVSYYPSDPIQVTLASNFGIPYNQEYSVTPIKDNKFILRAKLGLFSRPDTVVPFFRNVEFQGLSFMVNRKPESQVERHSDKKYFFVIKNMETLIEEYRERLVIEPISRDGTIIRLSLEGTNKAKDIVFLNKLTQVFLTDNLDKKNLEATRIIEFIDAQLVDVSDSLMITENQLQEFRSRNRIMDVSAQSQQIINQAVVLDNEKARLTLEANYYEYLTEYLSKENNQEVPISPATMGIEDPLLSVLMQDLAGLQAEYFSSGTGERNPITAQLELRIRNTKASLRETLQGIIRANNMAQEENDRQIQTLNREASRLPAKERQLLGIERKFNLNNELYNYLLQQRAEAQIKKASNRPDNELIDIAKADLYPVAPNVILVYMLGLILGLGLPLGVLILIELLNNKINSEEDMKLISSLPITGYIPHSKLDYQTVVLNESQSQIAEAFRSLRSRMQFYIKGTDSPVIIVTSSIPGEGKTFTAVNLASAYSLTGKRVVLLGFDLRRPQLSPDFGMDNKRGLSTYLIGQNKLEEVIQKSAYENLDVIPAGPIPPNPSELTESEETGELISKLKELYDYIIIDTAPIGVVSDGYTLAALADATIILVRHRKSLKRPLESTLSELKTLGIKGVSLLVNDVILTKGSYQYAYKYKYNYQGK